MSTTPPYSIKIYLADGDPDGVRIIERSNWIGKAVLFARAGFTKAKTRDEFKQTGVYLLLGPRPDGEGEMLYIGEGDPVRPRLEEHHVKKDFWTQGIFYVTTGSLLNKAHVQYLESKLVSIAKEANRVKLDNGNMPALPTLSEADRSDMESFLAYILGMLPVLGVHAFEKAMVVPPSVENPILYCKNRGADAQALNTPQGFVVLKGSLAAADEVPSFKAHWARYSLQRDELKASGVLAMQSDHLVFTQDYTFSSPSMASAMVMGGSPNGRTDWKTADGQTLKDLQAAETQNSTEPVTP